MTVSELAKILMEQPKERHGMPVFIRVESDGFGPTYDEVSRLDLVTLFDENEAVPTLVLRSKE